MCIRDRSERERQRQVVIQFNKARKWTKRGGRRQRDREVEVHDFKDIPGHGGLQENEIVDRLARRGATGVATDDAATPADRHDIHPEDLVVTTALGKRDHARLVPLDGLGGVLTDGKGPRASRVIGEVHGRSGGPGNPKKYIT